MSSKGDFTYNGIPVFKVGFGDFMLFTEALKNGSKILSRNVLSEPLREHYRNSRDRDFGVCYEGVVVDLRALLPEKEEDQAV